MLELSKDERELIEFARNEFGELITQFLLAGLGEEGEIRRWAFVIAFTDESGGVLHRILYVEADDLMPEIPTSLPRRREPLVLLALLRLLTHGHETPPVSLSYIPKDVLILLGWDDSDENRLAVEEAVGRYFFLSYRWEMDAEELGTEGITFHRSRERLISSYGQGEAGEPGKDRIGHPVNHVDFSPSFVKELTDRSLFGVNWNRVRNVERRTAG